MTADATTVDIKVTTRRYRFALVQALTFCSALLFRLGLLRETYVNKRLLAWSLNYYIVKKDGTLVPLSYQPPEKAE